MKFKLFLKVFNVWLHSNLVCLTYVSYIFSLCITHCFCLIFYFNPLIICLALLADINAFLQISTTNQWQCCNNNNNHNNKSSIEQQCNCSEWHSLNELPAFTAWRHKHPTTSLANNTKPVSSFIALSANSKASSRLYNHKFRKCALEHCNKNNICYRFQYLLNSVALLYVPLAKTPPPTPSSPSAKIYYTLLRSFADHFSQLQSCFLFCANDFISFYFNFSICSLALDPACACAWV